MKRDRLINVLAIGLSVLILLAIGMVLLLPAQHSDALDGRTELEALLEAYNYLELVNAPTQDVRVLGYRAGWSERFAKIRISRSDLPALLSQAHCTKASAIPDYIDGMDPKGIELWWTPRDVAPDVIVECRLNRRVGKGAIVVHDEGDAKVTVFLYAFKS
jgi:hypothetical protein